MGEDESFDLISLILVLALFTPIMIFSSIPLFKGYVGEFGTQIEKTALPTEGEIIPVERELTTDDAILMLAIADRYTPMPKALKVDVGEGEKEINIDMNFISNRTINMQDAKGVMQTLVPISLDLYSGPSGMRHWQISRK
jgi:hypothetical protein